MDTSMNIVMNEIDSITLNYFANKSQYDSILKRTEYGSDKQYKNDIKFYKKRILDLTKRLFRSDEEKIDDIHVNKCFVTYVKACVKYLKFIDKSDIIQQKYETETDIYTTDDPSSNHDNSNHDNSNHDNSNHDNSNHDNSNHDNSNHDNSNQELNSSGIKNCDHLFSRVEDVKKVTLDNFVIKSNESSKQKILPKKEEINIKTKEHKRKGISKKKNIKNIYEDAKDEKK
jgi:hypothetical protein